MITGREKFHKERNWYVFYTYARAEQAACDAVSKLGFPVFVPTEKRIQRLPNGKPRPQEKALFPRYGFVQFGPADPWSQILDADGVMDILRHDLTPIAVPDDVMNKLRLAQKLGVFDHTKPPEVGTEVQVTSGPFGGWIGKILRCRTGDRADVLLKFLGAECSATIPLMALKEIA